MSACTYTSTIQKQEVFGNRRIHVIKFVVTSYGTVGITLTTANTGLAEIDTVLSIISDVANDVANGPVAALWNPATNVITFIKASDTLVNDATAITAYVTVMGG
jgi:hypothetical protein